MAQTPQPAEEIELEGADAEVGLVGAGRHPAHACTIGACAGGGCGRLTLSDAGGPVGVELRELRRSLRAVLRAGDLDVRHGGPKVLVPGQSLFDHRLEMGVLEGVSIAQRRQRLAGRRRIGGPDRPGRRD